MATTANVQFAIARPPSNESSRPQSKASKKETAISLVPKIASSINDPKYFGFGHEDLDNNTAFYEGEFKLYQRSGRGELRSLVSDAKYIGQFQADRFHGQGDNMWSDGSRYVGHWKNGQKHGNGEYVSADNLRYVGQWEKNRRHGIGTQFYANGDKYHGGWLNGLLAGIGTYSFANGSRYEGTWSEGRHDGMGVFYGADNSRERREYKTGYLVRREVLVGGPAPEPGRRRDLLVGRPVLKQGRSEVHTPVRVGISNPSPHLIRRSTDGIDLSVPPLAPRTAPARMCLQQGDPCGLGGTLPPLPSTAPARMPGAALDG